MKVIHKRRQGERQTDHKRPSRVEWTSVRKRVANDYCILWSASKKSVAASQRHAAASLGTNSRRLEKVTMSKSHVNGETFSKWHSRGTWPFKERPVICKGYRMVRGAIMSTQDPLPLQSLSAFPLLHQRYRSVIFYFPQVIWIISYLSYYKLWSGGMRVMGQRSP